MDNHLCTTTEEALWGALGDLYERFSFACQNIEKACDYALNEGGDQEAILRNIMSASRETRDMLEVKSLTMKFMTSDFSRQEIPNN